MVKTLRISDDSLHTELLKIQGEIQAKLGEFTSMDYVINELVKEYRKKFDEVIPSQHNHSSSEIITNIEKGIPSKNTAKNCDKWI